VSSHGRNTDARSPVLLSAYDTPADLVEAICGKGWSGEVLAGAGHGRGLVRVAEPQPPMLAELLAGAPPIGLQILEPSAGDGAFPRALLAAGHPPERIEVMDLDPLAACYELAAEGVTCTRCRDSADPVATGFLITEPATRPDLVLGNPPYNAPQPSRACTACGGKGGSCRRCGGSGALHPKPIPVTEDHVRRGLAVTGRHLVYVLQVGFLGSNERHYGQAVIPGYAWDVPLFELPHLREIRIVTPRPKFRHGRSDSAETIVAWWDLAWGRDSWTGGRLRWTGRPDAPGSRP